jgi:hypothetical protein
MTRIIMNHTSYRKPCSVAGGVLLFVVVLVVGFTPKKSQSKYQHPEMLRGNWVDALE